MSAEEDRGLSQIDHPDREYVPVYSALPKEVVAEILVNGFSALLKKQMQEDPLGTLDMMSTAVHRSNVNDENHRTAEGYV